MNCIEAKLRIGVEKPFNVIQIQVRKMKRLLLIVAIMLALVLSGCAKDEANDIENEEKVVDAASDIAQDTEPSEETPVVDPIPDPVPDEPEVDIEELPSSEKEEQLPKEEPEVELPDEPAEPDAVEEPAATVQPEYVGVTDIKLSTYSVSVTVGEKKMPIVTMYPQNSTNKKEIWTSSNTDIATVDGIGNIKGVAEGECTVTVTSVDNASVSATVSVTVQAIPECTYIDGILVVNKTYPLPASYAPGWDTEASGPLWEMIAAAKKDGIKLWMTSGYRSYYDQQYIYNGYVKRDGQEMADTYSARAGHSEHQTGLAYDLNDLPLDFGDTPEGQWVAENCHKYGFILRYPKGKEDITGYMYEPWHIRYLGVEKATEVYESGLCLEEFLNITSKYAE